MSWGSGLRLFASLAEIIADTVSDENERRILYKGMIAEFESFDCDTMFECREIDKILDEVLDQNYEYLFDSINPEETEDLGEEDDEWPDGGREMF